MRTGRPGRPRKLYKQVIDDPETSRCPQEVNLASELDPMTLSEALNSPEAEEWNTAMYEEYEAHKANGTRNIVDSPLVKKPIGAKFFFKTKFDSKGRIERRKARLVAKGIAQMPGTDFNETFAPVARANSIRVIMVFAVEWN